VQDKNWTLRELIEKTSKTRLKENYFEKKKKKKCDHINRKWK